MNFKKILLTIFIIFFVFSNQVYADDEDFEITENISSFLKTSVSESEKISEPSINSKAAIVLDRNSNLILYGKNENQISKMASTTKIMTCIIVIENSNLDDIVAVSANAARIGGSRLGLHENDKVTVRNLLYGLMLVSGNDARNCLS